MTTKRPNNSGACLKCKLPGENKKLAKQVTALSQALEEKEKSCEHLMHLYGCVEQGIAIHEIVMDERNHPCGYKFVDANPAFERLTGISKNQLAGRSALELLPHLDKSWLSVYATAAITGKPVRAEKYSARLGKWLEVSVFAPNNNYFAVIIADITARKMGEEEIRHARDLAEAASIAKSRFLASMSHEIRTPMTAVIGFLQIMLSTRLTPEQEDYVASAKSSSDNLITLINDILDFSKIEAGKMELAAIDFDLKKLLQETAEMFHLQIKQKNLQLECCIEDPALPAILNGDPMRLKQVLINLLGNAIKFTEKGRVTLKLSMHSQTESEVMLLTRVEDTGVGIPEDKRNHLMQLFAQADPAVSQKFGGSGLGLAISKRLATMMGGALLFESVQGQGTLFYFTAKFRKHGQCCNTPAEIPHAEAPCAAAPKREPLNLRILAAEDNPSNQKLIKVLLSTIGCQTVLAEDGQAAVEAFEKGDFDVVLMDIQMPIMDGIQAMLAIKQHSAQRKIKVPVIALTAKALEEDRKLCLNAGMDGYLAKPISIDALYGELRKITPRKPAGQ